MKHHAVPLEREIELDFIRGIALLLVVDFHSPFPLLKKPLNALHFHPFGWMGINIFFILSGFLVGGLLMKEWKVRKGIDSKRFLIRRGFKIWPQYYFFLFVAILSHKRTFHELIGNFLNIQNYVPGIALTWSLAVEEHAYIFLAIVLALAAKYAWRIRSLFTVFACLCVAIAALRYVLWAHGINYYQQTHTRMDSILLGVLIAMVYHFAPERFGQLRSQIWIWWIALAISLLVIWWGDQYHPVPWWLWTMSSDASNLFAIAVFFLLYRGSTRSHSWLYRAVAWIGVYSYGIYLWHVSVDGPIASFVKRHAGIPNVVNGVLIVVAGIVIGVIMTKLIEFPALQMREKFFPRRVDSPTGTPAQLEAPAGVDASF